MTGAVWDDDGLASKCYVPKTNYRIYTVYIYMYTYVCAHSIYVYIYDQELRYCEFTLIGLWMKSPRCCHTNSWYFSLKSCSMAGRHWETCESWSYSKSRRGCPRDCSIAIVKSPKGSTSPAGLGVFQVHPLKMVEDIYPNVLTNSFAMENDDRRNSEFSHE